MSDPIPIRVSSEVRWSHTGIQLTAGRTYRIAVVPPEQIWLDDTLEYTADGGTSSFQRFFRPLLRVKQDGARAAEFFTLIATIGESLEHARIIGVGPCDFTAPVAGELVCFANDCSPAYWNNHGSIDVIVTPLAAGVSS